MKGFLTVAALTFTSAVQADLRPEIFWSTNFSADTTSDVVQVVRFSEREPDMVYLAGTGTAVSAFSDVDGNHYDAFPYTTILPSPELTYPADRHHGMFVAKMNYRTNDLVFLTFVKLDPKRLTEVTDMDFDENGNIYLVGNASHFAEQYSVLPFSFGFVGCRPETASGFGTDGVFVKLNADATQILRSCFWGYSGDDKIHGIAVISDGDFIIVGETTSTDFNVNNEDQATLNGSRDGFFAHFVNDGSLLVGTYVGGSGEDALLDVTLTDSGRLLASGVTESLDFPTTVNAYQRTTRGGLESLVLEFDLDRRGSEPNLQYATYFGGTGHESAQEITEDGYGDIYIVGTSNSQDYPTIGSASNTPTATAGLVVSKFDAGMSRLLFSTFEGHSTMNFWSGESIAVSDVGDIVVTGEIDSTGFFPWHNRLLELDDPNYSDTRFFSDAYLFKWLNSSTGYTRDYTTLLGGSGVAKSVDMKGPGELIVGGITTSNAYIDKTYRTVPESIIGEDVFGPFAMVVTNDIPPRQLPGSGGGGSSGGSGGGSGGGGGALALWMLTALAAASITSSLRRRRR